MGLTALLALEDLLATAVHERGGRHATGSREEDLGAGAGARPVMTSAPRRG
jgi:hypothetical protein